MSTLSSRYSDAHLQEILRRAEELDRERAIELDERPFGEPGTHAPLSEAAIARAEAEWLAARGDARTQRERAAFERDRRVAFGVHLGLYILVNFVLMILNLINDQSWFIWILFGWGLILAVHGFSLAQKDGLAYDNSFQQWKLYEGDGAEEPAH